MTRRRITLAFIGAALMVILTAFGALIYITKPFSSSRPVVTITPLDYSHIQFGILARVAITNVSDFPFMYGSMRGRGFLRIETKKGWITNVVQPGSRIRLPLTLPPGSNDVEWLGLPEDALRFQLCYEIPTFSARDKAHMKLSRKTLERLQPMLSRLLSTKPGPDLIASSEIFEVPKTVQFSPILNHKVATP
jgi:hypothetical protein